MRFYGSYTAPKHTDEWSTEMKRKMHPADIADRERIAEAVEFTAFLRLGPHHKIVERAQTLAGAALLANHIEDQHPGRKALVYAVLANGVSIPVPADMRQAALNPATENEDMTSKPLSAIQIAQLTAIVTGGGFKRANSRDAAVKRFLKVAGEAGVKAAEGFLGMPFDKACEELRAEVEALKADAIVADLQKKSSRKAAVKVATGAAPEAPAKAEKPAKAKPLGKRAAILEAAQRGELPPVPDFSAETHKRFRPKLAKVVEMVEAGDIEGLKAFHINPVSSSPKAIARYRDLAIIALEARANQEKAA